MAVAAMGLRPQTPDTPPPATEPELAASKPALKLGMWQKLHHLFAKDDPLNCAPLDPKPDAPSLWTEQPAPADPSLRRVGVGRPRQATFKRQNSERRERLVPVEPDPDQRRAVSMSSQVSEVILPRQFSSSPASYSPARISGPAAGFTLDNVEDSAPQRTSLTNAAEDESRYSDADINLEDSRPLRPVSTTSSDDGHDHRPTKQADTARLDAELDTTWILNLSMHFRDKSDREKFFVTYAQLPTKWRRVTVSCDYRTAEPGSLERDLKELHFQRDKSLHIYDAVRDSLPDIQFYDTVTNLKLETSEGRLHVHVTEDVNEIIPYPPRSTVAGLLDREDFHPMQVCEGDLAFESHLSGFVYKVSYQGRTYIKKEIPGPDAVDEFLYEINALHALHGSQHVIPLEGVVLDNDCHVVKGLLIAYADQGAVVDLLYDRKGGISWQDRVRWGQHAVQGLSEIHGQGYVQGDFTLSNIVVDASNNAQIIDINRRGCPVGWEPPEIATKIASNQRISMYIGEKSDLYQLGMTLWALAMDDDEPERHDPPLSTDAFPTEIPDWYANIVRNCLSAQPRDRLSAKELLLWCPTELPIEPASHWGNLPQLSLRTGKRYIDPAQAVERDDIVRFGRDAHDEDDFLYSSRSSRDDYTFTYPRSSNYDYESTSSAVERPRGRRPPTNSSHLTEAEHARHSSTDAQLVSSHGDDLEPQILSISPGGDREYEELELDGHPYLISRDTFSDAELQILDYHPDARRDAPVTDAVSTCAAAHDPPVIPEMMVRRPGLSKRYSGSESTPRTSHIILPLALLSPSAGSAPEASSHSQIKADLEEVEDNSAISTDTTEECATSQYPPRLPYADSGYDEPLIFGEPDEEPLLLREGLLTDPGLHPWGFRDQISTTPLSAAIPASEELRTNHDSGAACVKDVMDSHRAVGDDHNEQSELKMDIATKGSRPEVQ